ncbi:MAG TPA: gamma-glutamylcyclotransferase family protein [Chitinophagaceae bacterium]|nr:gamma-glutamylcyclotransferase family protein [Chitinophagaceae bacterium]
MASMMEYLFSYGTLQKEKVQLELFGRLLTGTTDTLQGYKADTIEIKDEDVLSKSEQQFHLIAVKTNNLNNAIEGTVFELTPEELATADSYETEEYVRVKVKLKSGKESWVYAAR